ESLDRLRKLEHRELLAQQLRKPLGIARLRGKLHTHFARRAAEMHETERESAHAGVARGEQPLELHEKAASAEKERLGMAHFRRQLELCAEALGRGKEFARLGKPAERAVELIDQFLAAALRQSFARQRQQLAQCRYAYAAEERSMLAAHHENRQLGKGQSAAAGAPQRGARGR